MWVRADGMSSGDGGKEKPLDQCERQDKVGGGNKASQNKHRREWRKLGSYRGRSG